MKKKKFSKFLLLLLALALVVGLMPVTAMAASRTTTLTNMQEEDTFTDNYLYEGSAYSKTDRQQPSYMDSSATYYSSWVGADESLPTTYQRSAIKFDISDISGTITSATLKIHVMDVVNSPIVYLIKTTDDTWSAQNEKFPSYNSTDYIDGYSSTPVVDANSDITFTVTDYLQERVDEESSAISFVLTGQEGSGITSYFSFVNMLNDASCGFIPTLSITYDAVNAPMVSSSASITNDATPTWVWSPNTTYPGNGTYCYQIDNDGWSDETMNTAFTPDSNLDDGQHILYVRESNGKDWSRRGSYSITVDTAPPSAPNVSAGAATTTDTTPTWTWSTGGGGDGTYRYKLDDGDLSAGATETTSTTFTAEILSEGEHTLYVQERDPAGNWSNSGTFAVTVGTVDPAPVVNGATISPTGMTYDLSSPADIVANITWNSASTVTNVVYGTTPLETPDMYVVSGSVLTIKSSYINTLGISEGDVATFTISFDKGDSATLTASFERLGAPIDVQTVASADELKAALATTTPINITLTQDIILQDKAEVKADHTLTVPENKRLSTNDQGSIDLGGKTLTVTGGGSLDSKTYNSNLLYNGNLTLKNIDINLNNTNDSGVNAGTIDMNSGAIIHIDSKNGSVLLAANILNINDGATLYIEKFANDAVSVENDATLNINGGNVIICPGTDSEGAGIGNSGKIKLISGTLANSRTGGAIHLNPNSTVEGMGGRLMDRGNLLATSGEVTLAAGNAAPSTTGLTAGTYLWDGEYFTKPILIEWTGLEAADGVAGTTDTTKLTLTFSADPGTLSIDDIEVTGATEENLSGSGLTRTLLISDIAVVEGEKVKVTIADPVGYAITPDTMETAVHRGPTSVQVLETKLKALGFDVTVNEDTITVSGRKTGATAAISLNIPSGITVKWGAELTGALERAALLMVENEGNLEIISGAKLENTASMGITLNTYGKGSLLVSGGDLSFKGSKGTVISVRKGTCVIKGGTVTTADNSEAYQLIIDGVLAVIPSNVEINKIVADNIEGPSAVVRLDSAQSRAMIGSAQGLTVTAYKLKEGNSLTAQWLVRSGVSGINVLNHQNNNNWFVPYSGVELYVPVSPSIITESLQKGTVNSAYSQVLEATGDKPITWSIEDGSLPDGLTLNGSTGVISGTPAASGTFHFVVRAANMSSDTQELSILIEQAPVLNPTIITSDNHKTVVSKSGSTFQVTATGTGTMVYSLSGAVPFGVSIHSSTGLMTIDAIDISGFDSFTYTFTVNADNGIDPTAAQDFTLTVLSPPVIRLPGFNPGKVGVSYEVPLAVSGAAPISWSVVSGALPAGLSLSTTGLLSGTPTTAGTSTFSIRAENSAGIDTQQHSIIILEAGGTNPTTYAVTFDLAGGTRTGGGELTQTIAQGSAATAPTVTRSGYTFNGWDKSFSNITGAMTVTALWTYNSGSGGNPGSGGSSGGGSVSNEPTPTVQPGKIPNQPVRAEITVTAKADKTGLSTVAVSEQSITNTIAKAQTEAKTEGTTDIGICVALNVTMPKDSDSLNLTLTSNSLQSLINANVQNLEINGSPVSLGLDLKALQEIQKQSTGTISISIAPVTELSKEAKSLIGSRPVYSITISTVKDGQTNNVSSLGGGTATLSIPYTPGRNEAVGYLFGVYVDANGKAQRIDGSSYDANSGSLLIPTGHFSVYGVGYAAPNAKFTDIGTHWGKEAIDYVVGKGLLSGTTETTFAPDIAMTRGMLVTALGRLAGVDVKAYNTNRFTDVKADSAFCPYIEWAYKKGIVQGIGNDQFAPDRAITREEIAVIFSNYAKATGYTLPVTRTVVNYADDSSIGSTYKTAVTAMQQAGIMMGGMNNKFHPKASATRAEVSSMLHRYIKLVGF